MCLLIGAETKMSVVIRTPRPTGFSFSIYFLHPGVSLGLSLHAEIDLGEGASAHLAPMWD